MTSLLDNQNGSVEVSIQYGIARITFYHPKSNSLPGAILRDLARKIQRADEHESVSVIIVQSAGKKAFCAGASFDELIAIEDEAQGKDFFMGFALVLNAMRECRKPVLARVHGKAVGGGIGIAAAADVAYATHEASIKLSELAVGIGPFVVGPAIERKIGIGGYTQLALDARNWYTADWAHQKGLFGRLFDAEEAMDDALTQLAHDIAASNPEAVAELRRIQWHGTDHWTSLLEERAELSGRLVLSEFTRSYIAEFKK